MSDNHVRRYCMNPNCALDHLADHRQHPLILNGSEFHLLREREPLPEESMWMSRQLAMELLKVAQLTELQVFKCEVCVGVNRKRCSCEDIDR